MYILALAQIWAHGRQLDPYPYAWLIKHPGLRRRQQ